MWSTISGLYIHHQSNHIDIHNSNRHRCWYIQHICGTDALYYLSLGFMVSLWIFHTVNVPTVKCHSKRLALCNAFWRHLVGVLLVRNFLSWIAFVHINTWVFHISRRIKIHKIWTFFITLNHGCSDRSSISIDRRSEQPYPSTQKTSSQISPIYWQSAWSGSIIRQVKPSPLYPTWHSHLYEPF